MLAGKIHKKTDLSLMPLFQISIVRQPIQQADTQDHDEQPDGHYYEQGEPKPSQNHGGSPDP